MFKTYNSSSSLVITSRWFATSQLAVPASVRLLYWLLTVGPYTSGNNISVACIITLYCLNTPKNIMLTGVWLIDATEI